MIWTFKVAASVSMRKTGFEKTKGDVDNMTKTNKKGSAIALLPIVVFLLIFLMQR